jgi:hypothetical protein
LITLSSGSPTNCFQHLKNHHPEVFKITQKHSDDANKLKDQKTKRQELSNEGYQKLHGDSVFFFVK